MISNSYFPVHAQMLNLDIFTHKYKTIAYIQIYEPIKSYAKVITKTLVTTIRICRRREHRVLHSTNQVS